MILRKCYICLRAIPTATNRTWRYRREARSIYRNIWMDAIYI